MTRNGTEGRVYGGDPNLLHIPDGTRGAFGAEVASFVTVRMREVNNGRTDPLCPGCYMIALMNAAVLLAQENGQSIQELNDALINAFATLKKDGDLNEEMIIAPFMKD